MNTYNLQQGDKINFINKAGENCTFEIEKIIGNNVYKLNGGRNSFTTVNDLVKRFKGQIVKAN